MIIILCKVMVLALQIHHFAPDIQRAIVTLKPNICHLMNKAVYSLSARMTTHITDALAEITLLMGVQI